MTRHDPRPMHGAEIRLPDTGDVPIAEYLADVAALRRAIRAHDSRAAEDAWDRFERWVVMVPKRPAPVAAGDGRPLEAYLRSAGPTTEEVEARIQAMSLQSMTPRELWLAQQVLRANRQARA